LLRWHHLEDSTHISGDVSQWCHAPKFQTGGVRFPRARTGRTPLGFGFGGWIRVEPLDLESRPELDFQYSLARLHSQSLFPNEDVRRMTGIFDVQPTDA